MDNLLDRLRGLAKEEQHDSGIPDELRAPLSRAQREEIVAAVLATRAPSGAAVTAPAKRRFGRRAWVAFALPMAAAAGLVLASRTWLDPSGTLPALPTYEVNARGGMKELRHGEPESPAVADATARPARVGLESEIVVGCRPATAVEGPVAARVFVFREGDAGSAAEIAHQGQTAGSGAVEIRLRPFAGIPAIVDTGGPVRWTLRVAVGRPTQVAKLAPSDAAARTPTDGPTVRWLTVPLDLVAH